MEALDQLNSKLDQLIKKYAAVQAENIRLSDLVQQQSQTITSLNTKLAGMEQKMANTQLGATISNDEEKNNMRRQLDSIIGEIDKILHTLND